MMHLTQIDTQVYDLDPRMSGLGIPHEISNADVTMYLLINNGLDGRPALRVVPEFHFDLHDHTAVVTSV